MIRLSATTDFGLQLACWNSQPLAAVQVADVALAVHKLVDAAAPALQVDSFSDRSKWFSKLPRSRRWRRCLTYM